MALTLCLTVAGAICCCRYCKNILGEKRECNNITEIFKRAPKHKDGIVQQQPTYETFPDKEIGQPRNETCESQLYSSQEISVAKQQVICKSIWDRALQPPVEPEFPDNVIPSAPPKPE